MHAITPARSTDGSAPVRIVKNATAPKPTANFGHRESRSSAVAAKTGCEHHRHVPARDDEEVTETGGAEVAFEAGIEPGVVA